MCMEKTIEQDLEKVFNQKLPWERLDHKTVLITGAYGMLKTGP